MPLIDPDCPCTDENMRNLAAPWILLTLHNRDAIHGYEIGRIVGAYLEETVAGLSLTGLYRHLNMLEKRGMLTSEWDLGAKGPAKRRYTITDAARECLARWIGTLGSQLELIGKFFEQVRSVFPNANLPHVTTQPAQIR